MVRWVAILLLLLLHPEFPVVNAASTVDDAKPRDRLERELLAAGTAALHEVASRPGILRLLNGILIEILVNSTIVNAVSMHATGYAYMELTTTLIDGYTTVQPRTKVTWAGPDDASYKLPGLWEFLKYMVVGDKWRAYLSHELHYGARGNWDIGLPPFSPLIYEVELLQVGPADQRLLGLDTRRAFQRAIVTEVAPPPDRSQ